MDIIASHRHGLIEQLDEEVASLAGQPHDHAQRAVVLHHLYDHSRGGHLWALAEARRALHIARGLGALRRRIDRWSWFGDREQARRALEQLADAMGEAARLRTAAAYRAYRICSTHALRDETETLGPDLVALLDQCHDARRNGTSLTSEAEQALAEASEQLAAAAAGSGALEVAWTAVNATGLRRSARRMLGDKALGQLAARDQWRGAKRIELELRSDAALPASFKANPAQHFYALQRLLHERRRRQWRHDCDQVPDAFELAA